MALLKRFVLILTTGYILCFFSELYFFNEGPGQTAASILATDPLELLGFFAEMCLYYGGWAFVFVWTINRYHIRSIWALFLAGAVFGWLTEGIIVGVIYESLPGSIVWPSVGWHALVDVLLGWYGIRLLLQKNNPWLTLAATVPLGLFWGVWATWFWMAEFPNEPPPLTPTGFAAFSFTFGIPCVSAYALQQRWGGGTFQPTRWETGFAVAWNILLFTLIVVPTYLYLTVLLPILLGVTYWALSRNKRNEEPENVIANLQGSVDWINYAILCLMCPLASISYALMYWFEIRWPIAELICTPLIIVGTVMLLVSFLLVVRGSPGDRRVLPPVSVDA